MQILLNLNSEEYDIHTRFDNTELAIVAAASIASWGNQKKQAMGFSTNGMDPIVEGAKPQSFLPHKGILHLMSILDILARVQTTNNLPFTQLIRQST